jgi:5'-3' exonuclease
MHRLCLVVAFACVFQIHGFRQLPRWGGLDRAAVRTVGPSQSRLVGSHARPTQLFGIPKLFRWLVELYPLVLETVGEGLNHNAMSVDNFYLDMNGIIHTCTHSNDDKLIPLKEQEMFLRIFAYTDRLYKLVSPRKAMFLAVDGVAPRAKMNQQRSRRFRSSKEREALIADHLAKEGCMPEDESFDSNCITPGTSFMHRLSLAFRKWIEHKMKTDQFWQNGAEVIFSGPDVPGEGEHKVMDLIREVQAKNPGATDRHCLYGLDADLIMLSLVTHEPHFVLLREKVLTRLQQRTARRKSVLEYTEEDFECLEVTILRKMLQQHYRKLGTEIEQELASSAVAASAEVLSLRRKAGSGQAHIDNGATAHHSHPTETASAAVPGKNKGKHPPSPPSESLPELKHVPWEKGFDLERIIDDFVFM